MSDIVNHGLNNGIRARGGFGARGKRGIEFESIYGHGVNISFKGTSSHGRNPALENHLNSRGRGHIYGGDQRNSNGGNQNNTRGGFNSGLFRGGLRGIRRISNGFNSRGFSSQEFNKGQGRGRGRAVHGGTLKSDSFSPFIEENMYESENLLDDEDINDNSIPVPFHTEPINESEFLDDNNSVSNRPITNYSEAEFDNLLLRGMASDRILANTGLDDLGMDSIPNKARPADDGGLVLTKMKRMTKEERMKKFARPEAQLLDKLKLEREKLKRDFISRRMMPDPEKQVSLEDAVSLIAICETMCPEFEITERIANNEVDAFEKDPVSHEIDHKLFVKKYKRSAAGVENPMPCDVRTIDALSRTLDYLFSEILNRDLKFTEIHPFIRDRARSVSRDFTFQHASGKEVANAYERIARFQILSMHELARYSPRDIHEEYRQWLRTLTSLYQCYEDLRQQGIRCPNEPEFRAYRMVDQFGEDVKDALSSYVPDPSVAISKLAMSFKNTILEIRPDPTDFSSATTILNKYSKFFVPILRMGEFYLLAVLLERHFDFIRQKALLELDSCPREKFTFRKFRIGLGLAEEDNPIEYLSKLSKTFKIGSNDEIYIGYEHTPLKYHTPKYLPPKQWSHSFLVENLKADKHFQFYIDGENYNPTSFSSDLITSRLGTTNHNNSNVDVNSQVGRRPLSSDLHIGSRLASNTRSSTKLVEPALVSNNTQPTRSILSRLGPVNKVGADPTNVSVDFNEDAYGDDTKEEDNYCEENENNNYNYDEDGMGNFDEEPIDSTNFTPVSFINSTSNGVKYFTGNHAQQGFNFRASSGDLRNPTNSLHGFGQPPSGPSAPSQPPAIKFSFKKAFEEMNSRTVPKPGSLFNSHSASGSNQPEPTPQAGLGPISFPTEPTFFPPQSGADIFNLPKAKTNSFTSTSNQFTPQSLGIQPIFDGFNQDNKVDMSSSTPNLMIPFPNQATPTQSSLPLLSPTADLFLRESQNQSSNSAPLSKYQGYVPLFKWTFSDELGRRVPKVDPTPLSTLSAALEQTTHTTVHPKQTSSTVTESEIDIAPLEILGRKYAVPSSMYPEVVNMGFEKMKVIKKEKRAQEKVEELNNFDLELKRKIFHLWKTRLDGSQLLNDIRLTKSLKRFAPTQLYSSNIDGKDSSHLGAYETTQTLSRNAKKNRTSKQLKKAQKLVGTKLITAEFVKELLSKLPRSEPTQEPYNLQIDILTPSSKPALSQFMVQKLGLFQEYVNAYTGHIDISTVGSGHLSDSLKFNLSSSPTILKNLYKPMANQLRAAFVVLDVKGDVVEDLYWKNQAERIKTIFHSGCIPIGAPLGIIYFPSSLDDTTTTRSIYNNLQLRYRTLPDKDIKNIVLIVQPKDIDTQLKNLLEEITSSAGEEFSGLAPQQISMLNSANNAY